MGYSRGDHKELDTAERLTHTFVILLKKKKNDFSVLIENHFMYLQSIKIIFFFKKQNSGFYSQVVERGTQYAPASRTVSLKQVLTVRSSQESVIRKQR